MIRFAERIHISEQLKVRLESSYKFEARGEMEIAGHKMNTYFIIDPEQSPK